MARITGIGGVFFHSPDPKALAAWYQDKLGIKVEAWGGSILRPEGEGPAYQVWSPFYFPYVFRPRSSAITLIRGHSSSRSPSPPRPA
jgi:hypothetical protein